MHRDNNKYKAPKEAGRCTKIINITDYLNDGNTLRKQQTNESQKRLRTSLHAPQPLH